MNFLNVGPWELTVVLMIAILMIGPKKMVELARTIRRYATQLRKLSGEFTTVLQSEIQATEQGARQVLSEVRQVVEETQAAATDALLEPRVSEQGGSPLAVASQVSGGDEKGPGSQADQGLVEAPEPVGGPESVEKGETRPLMDVFKDGLGISSFQAEMQAIGQETRQVLGSALSGGLALSGLQEEIKAVGKETRQAVETVEQTVKSSISDISVAPADLRSSQSEAPQRSGGLADAVSDEQELPQEPQEQRSTAVETVHPRSPLKNSDVEEAGPTDSSGLEARRIEEETA